MRFATRLRQERKRRHLSQEALAEALRVSPRSIVRWEQGRAVPQASVRLHISRFFHVPLADFFEDQEASAPSSLLWSIPFPRNSCFTGREEILHTLHTLLTAEQPVTLTYTPALTGLGGIGKTQVAIEYAYRYASEYRAVFWLAAETTESLMMSLQLIADQLHLPERQATEQPQMVAAVQRWLATHQGWLLIGDNVEDPGLLQTVLPPVRQGALLLTTRRQALGTLAESLVLPPMSCEEGMTLVLRRAKQLHAPVPDTPSPQGRLLNAPTPPGVTELVRLLEGLPLALDQAGAYIEEIGCSIADYLQRYRDQRQHVLARRGTHSGAHPASVATTLRLSVEQVEREHAAAAELLRLCTFLHPEGIPEGLLVAGASHLGPVLGPVVADAYQFDQALAALRNASLVTRHPGRQTLSVHRLVQAVLQDQMEPAETRRWSERVVHAVNAVFPEPEFDAWGQCEQYLGQVRACVSLVGHVGTDLPAVGEVLSKAGRYLMARGRYQEAKPLLTQAVALAKQQQKLDHPALISRLLEQGELSWRLGEYEAAKQQWQQALILGEQHLEPTHPQIAEALANLGLLSTEQGKYKQAAPLYQRSLHIQEQRLGSEHQEIATVLNTLALLYWEQGKYEQAEPLYQRALRIREQTLGPEHPLMGTLFNNLGFLYTEQGKYEQAEPLYQRALRIREQTWGPEHPAVAFSLIGLTILYTEQGRYEQAEPLCQRALRIREQTLGPEHPQVAVALSHLAYLYTEQGKYEQAEPLFQRTLCIQNQVLGPKHPKVAFALTGLATIYTEQGKYEQAELLFQRAVRIEERARGPKHVYVAFALHRLANCYRNQGKYTQAEPLYWRALALRRQALEPQHVAIAATLHDLAILQEAQGNNQDARQRTVAPGTDANC